LAFFPLLSTSLAIICLSLVIHVVSLAHLILFAATLGHLCLFLGISYYFWYCLSSVRHFLLPLILFKHRSPSFTVP
jgi:hypothetical protein